MDQLKYGVFLAAVAGIVGCFLALGPSGASLFDMLETEKFGVISVLSAFGLAALMALIGIFKAPMLRWQGLLALIGFAYVIGKMRGGIIDYIRDGAIGAKLIGIAPLAGALFAILSLAFAAPAPRR